MSQIEAVKKAKEPKNSSHIRRTTGDWVFEITLIVVFAVFTLLCVFPFYYLFINTISAADKVNAGLVNFYPISITFDNYARLTAPNLGLLPAFGVTVLRTILGTALMVLVTAWAGYLVTKQKMWRRSLWYRALVVTMYFNAGLIPWFMNMFMLGLRNNILAYILPGLVAPYNIILVKTYIESIPGSLEESALIDGAGTLRIFRSIILPLSIPILATVAIFGAVGNWNSFQDSLLLMTEKQELRTLQHVLYNYLQGAEGAKAAMASANTAVSQQSIDSLSTRTVQYTIAMVSIIPILCVYPFMQRYFVKGIMLGAVKG